MQIITLTTDWGVRDYYAGSVKGSILSRNPDAKIVDITHRVAVFDIAFEISLKAVYTLSL